MSIISTVIDLRRVLGLVVACIALGGCGLHHHHDAPPPQQSPPPPTFPVMTDPGVAIERG